MINITADILQYEKTFSWALTILMLYLNLVLRPSEKFSSSSKTSKWIFEPSEFRARCLAFNFRAKRVRAKTFRAVKTSEQNPSEHELFLERKFHAFLPNRASKNIFFEHTSNSFLKLSPFHNTVRPRKWRSLGSSKIDSICAYKFKKTLEILKESISE